METREIMHFLMDRGWSARDIEAVLDGRVSVRSIYRWVRGERAPKTRGTLDALRALVEEVQKGRTP